MPLRKVVLARVLGERFHGVERLVVISDRLQILEARGADGSAGVQHIVLADQTGFVAFGCGGLGALAAGQHFLAQNLNGRASPREGLVGVV